MKIVISGASGFLGSWITRVLSRNHEIIALVRPESNTSWISEIQNIKIIREKSDLWHETIQKINSDALILCDWEGVGNQDRNSKEQFLNVFRLNKIVESLANSKTKIVLGIGSQAELGPISEIITESALDNPTTLYGEAKVKSRLSLEAALKDSDVRFVWMRIFSIYGPFDNGNWLIPNLIDTLIAGNRMSLTKCEQEWSYLHAYDLANAFECAIINESICGIVNVGNPQTIILKDAVQEVAAQLQSSGLLDFGKVPYRDDQVMKMKPACETLSSFQWSPQVGFGEGIRQTILWKKTKQLSSLRTKTGLELDFS